MKICSTALLQVRMLTNCPEAEEVGILMLKMFLMLEEVIPCSDDDAELLCRAIFWNFGLQKTGVSDHLSCSLE